MGCKEKLQDVLVAAVAVVLIFALIGTLFGAMAGAYFSPKATAEEIQDATPIETYVIIGVAGGVLIGGAIVALKLLWEMKKATQVAVMSALATKSGTKAASPEDVARRRAKIQAAVAMRAGFATVDMQKAMQGPAAAPTPTLTSASAPALEPEPEPQPVEDDPSLSDLDGLAASLSIAP
jgi:hypothetical protein